MLIALAGCATRAPETVSSVNLTRYAGTWHEIARLPNPAQDNAVGESIHTFQPGRGRSVQLGYRWRERNGKITARSLPATVVRGSNNTRLIVDFQLPAEGDYWILGLDEANYSWALVGHPSREFLWVYSRTPEMRERRLRRALAIADREGFATDAVIRTPR